MAKKFPDRLFVKREQDGDASWFLADEDEYELTEHGGTVTIAEYKLVTTRKRKLVMFHTD